MKKLFTLVLFILYGKVAAAQFNDTTHYYVLLASTGSINKTNNDRAYLLNNTLNFGIKKRDVTLNYSNTWIYGKQNNMLTNNDFSSSLF